MPAYSAESLGVDDARGAHQAVNAGEILQRPAGVKVQHGRKQEGPDIGGLLPCLVSFLRGGVRLELKELLGRFLDECRDGP